MAILIQWAVDQNGALYQSLKDQINVLQKKCAALETGLSRMIALHERHADWCLKQFKLGTQENYDTMERVAGLEEKVFPGMRASEQQLRNIIGSEGTPYQNPLDIKRKPPEKKD